MKEVHRLLAIASIILKSGNQMSNKQLDSFVIDANNITEGVKENLTTGKLRHAVKIANEILKNRQTETL